MATSLGRNNVGIRTCGANVPSPLLMNTEMSLSKIALFVHMTSSKPSPFKSAASTLEGLPPAS